MAVCGTTRADSAGNKPSPQRRAIVDLNYLFHRQQVERRRSETALHSEARSAHRELARRYESKIVAATGADYRFPEVWSARAVTE